MKTWYAIQQTEARSVAALVHADDRAAALPLAKTIFGGGHVWIIEIHPEVPAHLFGHPLSYDESLEFNEIMNQHVARIVP